MTTPLSSGLVWFRRDLRTHDHAALAQALRACGQVHCVFVFDQPMLDALPRQDRRVEFIRESLVQLDDRLRELAALPEAGLIVLHGDAAREIPRLARQLEVRAVFANHDDEPAALARDARVRAGLARSGIDFRDFQDHSIFERGQLLTRAGSPYTVFTPYRNAWLAKARSCDFAAHTVHGAAGVLAARPPGRRRPVPALSDLGFEPTNLRELGVACGPRGGARQLEAFMTRIDRYHLDRDHPALEGTSGLGVHLRHGTVSIREVARRAHALAEAGRPGAAAWRNELIWREFSLQILANFPRIAGADGERRSFRPAYDAIEWERGPRADRLFAAWAQGRTGYPLVDAAMAQLDRTGFMHNRLRMVVASFLVKDLGIDWRRGERWFADRLLDYDLAANNGGWQWVASSGCDAQPWFRIFNPVTQSRRFDAQGQFIRRFLPQLAGLAPPALHAPWTASPAALAAAGIELGTSYPAPVVDHATARVRTLRRYAAVRGAR